MPDTNIYTYKGYTGGLYNLSIIFRKNYSDLKKYIKDYDIEEAMEKSKDISPKPSRESFKNCSEFKLSDSDYELINKYSNLLQNFFINNNIVDEDAQQELYLKFYYYIHSHNKKLRSLSTSDCIKYIINILHSLYARYFRDNAVNYNQVDIDNIRIDFNIDNYILNKEYREYLRKLLVHPNITINEQITIALRIGLYDNEIWTLKAIGNVLHCTKERVRQIEKRALEKLKQIMLEQCSKEYIDNILAFYNIHNDES